MHLRKEERIYEKYTKILIKKFEEQKENIWVKIFGKDETNRRKKGRMDIDKIE